MPRNEIINDDGGDIFPRVGHASAMHDKAGGHSSRATPRTASVQRGPGNRIVATAARNRTFWDCNDPDDGGNVPYEFHEYPKHVWPNGPDAPYVAVNTAEEEDQAMATGKVVRVEDERKRLVALANLHGVQVDGRWAIQRIADAIVANGHDATANPFV